MIRTAVFALSLAACLPALAQAVPECALGKAAYRPVADSGDEEADYRAEMRAATPLAGNMPPLVLVMQRQSTGTRYSFRFHAPNGYGRYTVGLAPGDDKTRRRRKDDAEGPTSTALFFDAALKRIEPLFEESARAPAYMLLPDLGLGFWYWPPAGRTFVPPAGLWRLSGCLS